MKEVTIALPKTNIKKIESIIPSPLGNLEVKWDLNKNQKRVLELEVPQDMEIKLILESFEIPNGKSIQINNEKILLEAHQKSFYLLPSGKWKLVF